MHANRTLAPSPQNDPTRRRIAAIFAVTIAAVWLLVGCNEYPLQLLNALPYLEITDTLKQSKTKAVDILFVVDNSGSMKQEQEKLARNFSTFIDELTKSDVGDYQIGIISTDMANPLHRGKLLAKAGQPKIISRAKLPAPAVVEAFKQNIDVGDNGISFEKPLDAMRAALSPKLLDEPNANQGFLRPGALLAVIFVGDEDDCSHNGGINEDSEPGVCNLPGNQILRDPDGNPINDSNEKPIYGGLDKLNPVKEYIDFLKGLKREIIVGGLIGNPYVYRDPQSRKLVDPEGGCGKDLECGWQGQSHFCGYNTTNTRKCGGCTTGIDPKTGLKDADAAPGYRLYEIIKVFGGSERWFPICGDDEGFKQALFDFANAVINRFKFVQLTRKPADLNALNVKLLSAENQVIATIERATTTGRTCSNDTICGGTYVCGQDNQCYGDGWVYFLEGNAHKLRLSGNAFVQASPGTEIQVNYVADSTPTSTGQ